MAEFERLMAANEPEPESESLPPSAQVRKRLQNFEAPEVDFSALPGFDEKKRKALTESLEGIKSITTEYKRIQDEMKALKESLYNQNGFQELAGTLQDMRGIRSLLEQNAEGESSNDINAAPGPGGDPDEQMMARMLDARLKQRKAARTDSTGSPDGAPTSGKDGGKDDQPPDLSAKLNTVIEMLKRKKPKPRKEGSSAGLSREDLMKAINEEICDVDEKKKNLEHVKTELSRNIGGSRPTKGEGPSQIAEYAFGLFLFCVAVYLSSREVRAVVKEWWDLGISSRPVFFGPPTLAEHNAAQTWTDTASLIAERAEGRAFLNRQHAEFEKLAEEAGKQVELRLEEQEREAREKQEGDEDVGEEAPPAVDAADKQRQQEQEDYVVCYLWETVGKCANRVSEKILTNLDHMRDAVLPTIEEQLAETREALEKQTALRKVLVEKAAEWRSWEERVDFCTREKDAIGNAIAATNELADDLMLKQDEKDSCSSMEDDEDDKSDAAASSSNKDSGVLARGLEEGNEVEDGHGSGEVEDSSSNIKSASSRPAKPPIIIKKLARNISHNLQLRKRPPPLPDLVFQQINTETKYNFFRALWLAFRNSQEQPVLFHDLCVPHEDFRDIAWGADAKRNYDGTEKYDPATFVEPVPPHLDAPEEDRRNYALTAERAMHDIAEWAHEYQAARVKKLPKAEKPIVLRIEGDVTRAGSRMRATEIPLVVHSGGTARMLQPDKVLSSERSKQELRKFGVFKTDFQDLADDLTEVVHEEKDAKRLKKFPEKRIKAVTFEYQGRPEGFVNVIEEKEKESEQFDLSILRESSPTSSPVGRDAEDFESGSGSADGGDDSASHSGASATLVGKDHALATSNSDHVPGLPAGGTTAFLTEQPEEVAQTAGLDLDQQAAGDINRDLRPEADVAPEDEDEVSFSPPPSPPSNRPKNVFSVNPGDKSLAPDLHEIAKQRTFHGAMIVGSQHVALPGMKSLYERLESNRKPPSALLQKSGHQKAEVELDDGRVIEGGAASATESDIDLEAVEMNGGGVDSFAQHGDAAQIPLSRKQVSVAPPFGSGHTKGRRPVHSEDLHDADLPLVHPSRAAWEVDREDEPEFEDPDGGVATEASSGTTSRQHSKKNHAAELFRRRSKELRAKHEQSVVHVEGSLAKFKYESDAIHEGLESRLLRKSKERAEALFKRADEVLELSDLAEEKRKGRKNIADRKRGFMARSKTQTQGGGSLEAALAEMSESADESSSSAQSEEGAVGGAGSQKGTFGGGKKGLGKKGGKGKLKGGASVGRSGGGGGGPFGAVVAASSPTPSMSATSDLTSTTSDEDPFLSAEANSLAKKWSSPEKLDSKRAFFRLYRDLRLDANLTDWPRRKEYYLVEDLLQTFSSEAIQEKLRQQGKLRKALQKDERLLSNNEQQWRDVGKKCWRMVFGSAPDAVATTTSTAEDGTTVVQVAKPTREQQIRERRRKRQTLGKLKVVFDQWYISIQAMLEEAKSKKRKPWSLVKDYEDGRVDAASVIPDDFYAKNKSATAAASQRTQSSQPATANPTQEPSATTTTQPGASRELFAFDCEEANGHEKEEVRLARWKQEDPISLQEAYVTSNAFLKACRDNDVDEVHEIVNHAVYTDFLQYQVIQGYYACVQHLNFPLFRDVFDHQGFPAQLFPEIPHAVAELCGKENFMECRKFLKTLFTGFQVRL
eukprot:g5258.t1